MSTLHRPRSTAEALAHLASGKASLIAGGTDLFPALVDRPPPEELIDLSLAPDLRGISSNAECIRIGAATTWAEIAAADLPPALHMLQQAAREIGAIQIQNRATIGGNLCNASPAADGAPPLLALDAGVELVSVRGARTVALQEFITGNRRTIRAPDEIMTAVLVPRTHEQARSVFLKLGTRRYLVISIVMVAALLDVDAAGIIRAARIAVGAASPVAVRLRELEQRLVGRMADAAIADEVQVSYLSPLSPIDDLRASAAYRIDATRELLARALRLIVDAVHA